MSPKPADPRVRTALIETAARLLREGGSGALTIRQLAAEVGTSTMAVYTHFGGMEDLRYEMRKEGFARLEVHMRTVRATRDPVADLTAFGWAYCFNAVANPELYRVMFMEPSTQDPAIAMAGAAALQPVVDTARRCIEAGRFDPGDPYAMAVQLWTMSHGMVTLHLAGILSDEAVIEHMTAMVRNIFVGFGDSPDAAERSVRRAERRMRPSMPLATSGTLVPAKDERRGG